MKWEDIEENYREARHIFLHRREWYRKVIFGIRRVAESFSGWVRFSNFRTGLLKYYMLNVILALFKVPS